MSEWIEGLMPGEPVAPRESAVVVAARRRDGRRELLMHRRSARSSFLPGHWAFPGGRLDPADREQAAASPDAVSAHACCAARELREETGLHVEPEQLVPIAVRTTPPFHTMRFRTEFFFVELPPQTEVESIPPCPEECDEQSFVDPALAHRRWMDGDWPLPPVLPPLLRAAADANAEPAAELTRSLALVNELEDLTPRIEFVPGIWLVPQRSRTLPPASHTNAYLIGGRRFLVVDPGSADPEELALLVDTIRRRQQDGDRAEAIVLTHHHHDHTDGAGPLADLLRLPIRAHAATAERLRVRDPETPVAGNLADDERLDLDGLELFVRHVPGHAAGQIALQAPERKTTLVADLISGVSTIVIDPDDGDMSAHLGSLAHLAALDPGTLYPGHGPPQPAAALRQSLSHRMQREAQIAEQLGRGVTDPDAIARAIYEPTVPFRLAGLQVRAHLRRLLPRR